MHVLISGGLGKIKDISMISYYASLAHNKKRILYLPIAKITRPFPDSFNRMCKNMSNLSVKAKIEMWTDLKNKTFEKLVEFDSLYIEGGNPFILLKELKKSNFTAHLRDYIKSGRLVYGQSAGALILGKDISHATLLDDKNIVELKDTTGLNLFNEYSIWPHYTSSHDNLIKKIILKNKTKFIALPESTGLHISNKKNIVCGISKVAMFNKESKKIYSLNKNIKNMR